MRVISLTLAFALALQVTSAHAQQALPPRTVFYDIAKSLESIPDVRGAHVKRGTYASGVGGVCAAALGALIAHQTGVPVESFIAGGALLGATIAPGIANLNNMQKKHDALVNESRRMHAQMMRDMLLLFDNFPEALKWSYDEKTYGNEWVWDQILNTLPSKRDPADAFMITFFSLKAPEAGAPLKTAKDFAAFSRMLANDPQIIAGHQRAQNLSLANTWGHWEKEVQSLLTIPTQAVYPNTDFTHVRDQVVATLLMAFLGHLRHQ